MRVAGIAAAAAVVLALGYAVLVSPGFEPYLDDQVSYLRLAHGLVERGEYTRASIDAPFAPEPLRPPGYPLFLAPLCVPSCSHWTIAIVQALLYGALVLLFFQIARRALRSRGARIATVAVALYLPIAYFAAIAYSDFLATFLLVAGSAAFLRARRVSSVAWGIAAGALFGWLALTRAVYVLLPAALALMTLWIDRRRLLTSRALRPMLGAALTFAIVLAPLMLYSARYFGRPFASSSGSAVWLGAVQGVGKGDLDEFEAAELAAVNREVAAFDTVTDRVDQAHAWILLNEQLGLHGYRFIAHDPLGYVARTPVRALVLWAGDLPVPVDWVPGLDPSVRVLAGAIQLAVFVFGIIGAIALARRREDAALLPLVIILYVSAVALPLGTEARYALPAKPFVFIAAVCGLAFLARRRARDTTRAAPVP
jgi:4-amino-4-deoxy-L-arabinose transferase-like glycosyltransferase